MDTLPLEVLRLILSHLPDDQESLSRINQASTKLYNVSAPFLYGNPRFWTINGLRSFVTNISDANAAHVHTIDLKLVSHRWRTPMGHLLRQLVGKAKHIKHLNLDDCLIDSESLTTVLNTLHLDTLSVKNVHAVDDRLVDGIVANLQALRKVDLGGTVITDDALYQIGDHCPLLKSLDISDCQSITELGLLHIVKKCTAMTYVNVRQCYNVVPVTEEHAVLEPLVHWASSEDDSWYTDSDGNT